MHRVLLLGGLDPSGGAGLTADATVVAVHGAQPLPIVLALTTQNRHGFQGLHPVAPAVWRAALAAASAEGELQAIKVGLLGATDLVREVAVALRPWRGRVPIVIDPVLSATAGGLESAGDVAAAYREHLLPLASLFTPNLPELQAICGGDARRALALGCRAVLRKDGHGTGAMVDDVLVEAGGEVHFRRPRFAVGAVRGTGCALASAVACRLAQGLDLTRACAEAGDWLAALLQQLGTQPGDGLPRPLPLGCPPGAGLRG